METATLSDKRRENALYPDGQNEKLAWSLSRPPSRPNIGGEPVIRADHEPLHPLPRRVCILPECCRPLVHSLRSDSSVTELRCALRPARCQELALPSEPTPPRCHTEV